MSDKPTHWDWLAMTRAIRDGRIEPPEPGSPSAELAGELGPARGADPMNDRADEAAHWCELIMKSERRERLLQQFYGSGSDWLLNRLRGVIGDCLAWNPTDRPIFCHTALGHRFDGPDNGRYGEDFGTVLDLSDPVFNIGGAVLG